MKEIASLKEKKKRKSLQLMTRLELIISILAWISALICCVVSGMSIFVAYKVDKRSREALSEVRQKDTDSELCLVKVHGILVHSLK